MYTGLTTANMASCPTQISQITNSQEVSSTTVQTLVPPFNNPTIPKENIFSKIADFFLGADYFAQSKWQQKALPPLAEEQIATINKALVFERKIAINHVEIKFNLIQLFKHLLSKNNSQLTSWIADIELVGGAVSWVLGSYLTTFFKHFGVENPNEWLSDELLQEYAHPPKDFDFRIYLPNATVKDIETLKKSILEFFVEMGTEQNPSLEAKEVRQLLLKSGFTNYTQPKDLDQSLFATVGFLDVDLVIYRKLPRKSLFLADGLFLPIMHILKNEKLQHVPLSDFKNGCDAIFDRLSGIVRAFTPETINCAGWPCLLINYFKGKRCLTSDLEMTLLNKTLCTLRGSYAETDCPKELFKALRELEKASDPKRKACVLAYWLKKSITSHLNNDPSAALILTLQACISLKMNKFAEVIPEFWNLMEPSTKGIESDPLLAQIMEVMSEKAGFESLFALLQVKAFLYLSSEEKDPNFSANLIMHQGAPAIQTKIGKHFLLMPYAPSKALLDLKAHCNSNQTLEKLDGLLQVKNPYTKQQKIPQGTPLIWSLTTDFSNIWDRIAAEWFLACEIQCPTPNGSKLIEDFLPDLLSNLDRKQTERLLQSASNASSSLEKSKLFSNIRRACSGKAYAPIPMQLIVAISLAAVGDSASAYKAYTLWKTNTTSLPIDLNISYTKSFIQQLSVARPDLAMDVLSHLLETVPSFKEGPACLKNILDSKNKSYFTKNSLSQLVKATAKIYEQQKLLPSDIVLIHSLIEKMSFFKKECYQEIKSLWWLIYKETGVDIENLKKPFQFNDELLFDLMSDEAFFKNLNTYLELLSSFKPAPTALWKKLFEHLKNIKSGEVHSKAWKLFFPYLENIDALEGTSHEIKECWFSAIKTMADKNASGLYVFLGHEKSLISLFKGESQNNLSRILHTIFNALLYSCEVPCPQATLEKLLELRKEFETACHAPLGQSKDWKIVDTFLAEKLSVNLSVSLNLAAFIIYVRQGNIEEAGNIVPSLLKNALTDSQVENLVPHLLFFVSNIPKEKHALVLKILQAPHIGDVLKKAPSEALKVLHRWKEKLVEDKALTSKFNPFLMKQVLNLIPLVDASEIDVWVKDLIDFIENLAKNSVKSDLKNILCKSHDIILEALSKENNPLLILKLLVISSRLSLNVSFDQSTIDRYYKMFLSLPVHQDSKLLLEAKEAFLHFKNVIKEKSNPENDAKALFHLINLFRKQDVSSEETKSLKSEFLKIIKSNDLHNRLGPLLAHSKNLFAPICEDFLRQAIESKDEQEIAVAWCLFWEVFTVNNSLYKPLSGCCWSLILKNAEIFHQYHCLLLEKVDHLIIAYSDVFVGELLEQHSVGLLKLTYEKLHEIGGAPQQQLIEKWIKAAEKLEKHYINPSVIYDMKIAKAHVFALSAKPEQFRWGFDTLCSEIPNMPKTIEALEAECKKFLTMIGITSIEKFEEPLKKLLVTICQVSQGQDTLPIHAKTLIDYVLDQRSVKQAIQIFNLFQRTPCAPVFELCSIILLRTIHGSNSKRTYAELYDCFYHLNEFLKIASQKKYVFSSEFFNFTDTYRLSSVLDQQEALEHELIISVFSYIISINYNMLFSNPTQGEMLSKKQKLLSMISEFIPSFCNQEKLYKANLKMAFDCLQDMADVNYVTFSMSFPVLKVGVNRLAKMKLKSDCRFGIKLKLLLIENLLSINCGKDDRLSFLVRNELFELINYKDIKTDDVESIMFKYATYVYLEDTTSLNTEKSNSSNSSPSNRKGISVHSVYVSDVLRLARQKGLLPESQYFAYDCLLNLEESSGGLSIGDINESYKTLICTLLSKPSIIAISKALDVMETIPKKKKFNKSTLIYCWKIIYKAAAEVARDPITKTTAFDKVLDYFYNTQLEKPNVCVEVCEIILNELINPKLLLKNENNLPTKEDVCKRTAAFLHQAWKHGCFGGKVEEYYKLVDQFMIKLMPRMDDLVSYPEVVNSNVVFLVLLTIDQMDEKKLRLQVQMMSKWIRILSVSYLGFAKTVLFQASTLYKRFPEEHAELISHLKNPQ